MALQLSFAAIPIPIKSLSSDSITYLKICFLANFTHAFSISGTVKSHPDFSHSIGQVTKNFKEPIVRMLVNRTNFAGQEVLSNTLCTHRGYGGLLGPLLHKYVHSQPLRSHPEFYL